jgi:cytochrome c oxidase subunit II
MNELMRRLLFLPEQASTIARDVDTLHYFVIIVTMLGSLAVGIIAIYFVFKYRESKHLGGELPPDERPHHSPGGIPVWFEVSVLGGLLAMFVLWWVIGFRQFVHISEPPRDSLTIYVIGKQWMWSFAYPNGGGSNDVLYVPANRPVKLVMTSRDVIHSFYIPNFRVKRDVVPGRTTLLWFEATRAGRFPLLCTEFCGMAHSTMRGEVVVLPEAEYEAQLENLDRLVIAADGVDVRYGPRATGEYLPLAVMGQRVATNQGCLRCHTVDGTPHIGPTWAGLYGAQVRLADGETIIADEAYLTSSMMDPLAQLHQGFAPVMPSYQGVLSAGEVGALVEYIRSLRDVPRRRVGVPLPAPTPDEVPLVTPLPPDGEPR